MSTHPSTVPEATKHLNARRETAIVVGAAAIASVEQTVKDLKVFGYIAGDILTLDLKGLNAIRQMLDAVVLDVTALLDEIKAGRPVDDDAADDAVS